MAAFNYTPVGNAPLTNQNLLESANAAAALSEQGAGVPTGVSDISARLRAAPAPQAGGAGWLSDPNNVNALVQALGLAGNTIMSQGNPGQQALGAVGGLAAGGAQASQAASMEERLRKLGLNPDTQSQVTYGPGGMTIKGVKPEELASALGDYEGGGTRGPR